MAILIGTGWFDSIKEDLGLDRSPIVVFLLGEVMISDQVVTVSSTLQIYGGFLLFLLLFRFLLRRSQNTLYILGSSICLFASVLFFIRERISPVSVGLTYVIIIVTLWMVILVTCSTYSSLKDRMMVISGGIFLAEILRLVFHREELNPVLLGDRMFRDLLWASMLILLLVHYGSRTRQWSLLRYWNRRVR